jgi:LAO/AO transport system kinase
MSGSSEDAAALAAAVAGGERRALGRAITLVESERPEDATRAEELLRALLPRTGRSLRLGVTGPPGAGKSTLIDALGRFLIARGERVAVLAIDPSSPVGGGSILGDKTRMARLAAEPQSFIRPSPSGGTQGGVGPHTAEAVLLCEAAGYTVVIVETLGTGQGEHAAAELVDCLLLVLMPGAGDEVQALKRGAIELADVVVVNKADGSGRSAAEALAGELASTLGLSPRVHGGAGGPGVSCISATEERGLDELWRSVQAKIAAAQASGTFAARRSAGARSALARELERAWQAALGSAEIVAERSRLEADVLSGRMTARAAAERLVALLRGPRS